MDDWTLLDTLRLLTRIDAFDVIAELTFSRRLGFLESGADVDGMLDQLDKEFEYRAVVSTLILGRCQPSTH